MASRPNVEFLTKGESNVLCAPLYSILDYNTTTCVCMSLKWIMHIGLALNVWQPHLAWQRLLIRKMAK